MLLSVLSSKVRLPFGTKAFLDSEERLWAFKLRDHVTYPERWDLLMLLFAPYLMFSFFSGNVADFPTVLQPSSTCQGFRLLTVSCQRFTNQPIVFCVVRPTLNSLALAKRAVSLFPSRAATLVSRVSQLRRSRACIAVIKSEEKERPLAV